MRITNKKLRRIIREALYQRAVMFKEIRNMGDDLMKEGFMKERFGEIQNSIISVLEDAPGLGGMEIAQYVLADTSGYGMELPVEQREVFEVLDILLEDGEVFFNEEEDEWYLSSDTGI